MRKKILALVISVSFLTVSLAGCSAAQGNFSIGNTTNLEDYIEVSCHGLYGRGYAEISKSDMAETVANEDGAEDIDELFDTLEVSIPENGSLCDGDEFEVVVSCDEDIAKELNIRDTTVTMTETAQGFSTLDLRDYVESPSYKSLDGAGWLGFNFDYEKMKDDYEAIVNDAFYLDHASENATVTSGELAQYISYEVKNNGELSNGDEAEVTVSFDETQAKNYGVKDTTVNVTFVVEGLTDQCVLDPFSVSDPTDTDASYMECADIFFHGYSPYISIDIQNVFTYDLSPESNPYCYLQYEVNVDRDLSDGDEYTVTAILPEEKTALGYCLSEDSKTFTINRKGRNVTSLSDLRADDQYALAEALKKTYNNTELEFLSDGIFARSKDPEDPYVYLVLPFASDDEFGYAAIENFGIDEEGNTIYSNDTSFSTKFYDSQIELFAAIDNEFELIQS